jgi:TRAP transporter TAXI family solute receptor
MKRGAVLTVVLLLTGALVVPTQLAAQQRRLVTIASGWVVGVYYPLAGAMSRIAYNAKDLNIRATVESSGASVANAQLIGTKDADFALLQNDIAYYAYNGTTLAAFTGKPVKNMGGIFTIYPELVHVVATQASGVKSVRDLKGKRVVLGPQGSGTEQNALQLLEAYGLRESDLGRAERIDAAAAADQLKDGRVDAAFFTTGLGSAVIVDTFISGKAVMVPVGAEGEALRRKYPFYTMEKIPANTYKGQEQEVTTPAVMAMMVANSELPEDLVYRFTKAIFDNLQQFHAAHAAAKNLTLQTAQNGMPIPLHPGAEKFFKEKGIGR